MMNDTMEKTISLKISDELHELILKRAKIDGISGSEWIRRACMDYAKHQVDCTYDVDCMNKEELEEIVISIMEKQMGRIILKSMLNVDVRDEIRKRIENGKKD